MAMVLTKLFALFWLIPLLVSGSCPQDQKQISVRVTAEFRLHSFIKTVDHETTITASRNFASSFKKCRLAMKSGNSASSFGDAVQNILDTVASGTTEGDKADNIDTKINGEIQQCQNGQKTFHIEKDCVITNFLQLVRVITYSVRVDGEIAKILEKTTVDSIPVSSAGNYGDKGKYGETYIVKMFQNETGGNIVDNTFTVSTCYNESSQQEINELTQLKLEIHSLKKRFYKKLTDLTDQFRQQNITTNMKLLDLIQQNNRSNMQLSDITSNVNQQNTSLKQMNTTLGLIKQMNPRQLNSLKIVKAHGGLRADKCKFTCVGTTGRDSTSWSGGDGHVYTTVNMTSCGFVDVPVVTTSLAGTDGNMHMTGTAAPYDVTTVQFHIFLQGWIQTTYYTSTSIPSLSEAKGWKWNVNWAAYGYKEC